MWFQTYPQAQIAVQTTDENKANTSDRRPYLEQSYDHSSPREIAARIGLASGGIRILDTNIVWAKRDRFAHCVEALVEIEIAYQTRSGYVITRRRTLVNTSISRIGGLRARLTRSAALLTAVLTAPPAASQADELPRAA